MNHQPVRVRPLFQELHDGRGVLAPEEDIRRLLCRHDIAEREAKDCEEGGRELGRRRLGVADGDADLGAARLVSLRCLSGKNTDVHVRASAGLLSYLWIDRKRHSLAQPRRFVRFWDKQVRGYREELARRRRRCRSAAECGRNNRPSAPD
jgi:hypothetical protein